MNTEPTMATVRCFRGPPWKHEQRELLHNCPLGTTRLPQTPAERREL
jgi:hypothetical protein